MFYIGYDCFGIYMHIILNDDFQKGKNLLLVIYLMCLIIAAVFTDHIYNFNDNFASN